MTLFVKYICKPGQREHFLRALAEAGVVDQVRAEDGCLRYDYYLSLRDENEILLVEKWTEPEAQKVHMTQPHMKVLLDIKNRYVDETAIGDGALE